MSILHFFGAAVPVLKKAIVLVCLCLGLLIHTGCGSPPVPEEKDVMPAANMMTAGMEIAMLGLGLLTKIDLKGAAPDRQSLDDSLKKINEFLGACVTFSSEHEPKVGFHMAFKPEGCGIPLTQLKLTGGIRASVTSSGNQGLLLEAQFESLSLISVKLDGSVKLWIEKDQFAYDFQALTVKFKERNISINGKGTLQPSENHTSVVFNGTGSVTYNGKTFAFEATNLTRKFLGDCYAESGSLKLSYSSGGAPIEITLQFNDDLLGGLDSDDSGQVYVQYNGAKFVKTLEKRDGLCL